MLDMLMAAAGREATLDQVRQRVRREPLEPGDLMLPLRSAGCAIFATDSWGRATLPDGRVLLITRTGLGECTVEGAGIEVVVRTEADVHELAERVRALPVETAAPARLPCRAHMGAGS